MTRRARLSLERSGGFAGLTTRYAVDTSRLDPKRQEEYLSLLAGLDLADVAGGSGARAGRADQFDYDLRLVLDGNQHRLRFGEASAPPELKTLVRMIAADSAAG